MKIGSGHRVVLVAAVLSGGCFGVQAEDMAVTEKGENGVFLEIGIEHRWIDMPKLNSLSVAMDTNAYLYQRDFMPNTEFSSQGTVPRITIGKNLDNVVSIGRNPRVQLSAFYYSVADHANSSTALGGQFMDFLPIKGGPVTNYFAFSTGDVSARLQQRQTQGELNLSASTDFDTNSEKLTLTPTIGLTYGTLSNNYKLSMTESPLGQTYGLNERVRTRYFGPSAGLTAKYTPSNQMTLSLGADVGFFNAKSSLAANQDAEAVIATHTVVSENKSSFMPRLSLTGAVTRSLNRSVDIGLEANVTRTYRVPMVINPQSAPGVVSSTAAFPRAHIGTSDLSSRGITIRLMAKF